MLLHNVAFASTVEMPTLLVYNGKGSLERSMTELAGYQGISNNKLLYIDWKLTVSDFMRQVIKLKGRMSQNLNS